VSHEALIFGILALLTLLVIARTLQRWSREDENPFELRDLFMENGRASKGAVIMLGAFAATTWFFVFYSFTGRMTEGYFGLYSAAWIAPVVARMFTSAPPAAPKAAS
jgi:ABC-type multidrug transport system permease subunit